MNPNESINGRRAIRRATALRKLYAPRACGDHSVALILAALSAVLTIIGPDKVGQIAESDV